MDPERFKAGSLGNPHPADNLSDLPPAPPPNYSPRSGRKTKKWPWVVAAVVLIALLGLGAWAYKSYKSKPKPKQASSSQTTQPKPATPAAPAAPSVPTTSYTSTNFNTSFNYPNGWNLVDSGNAPLTVTSPVTNIVAANGQSVPGQIVITLANKGTLPPGFTTQSVAVMTSQKISFNQPSTTQAAQTYISFVQYPSTTTTGGLDGIYMTGNYGYQKDQTIPSTDIANVDPLVSVSFYSCASQSCPVATRKPLTISSSDWNNSSFSAPLLTTFKSFTFD